jgi:hypothetical protein
MNDKNPYVTKRLKFLINNYNQQKATRMQPVKPIQLDQETVEELEGYLAELLSTQDRVQVIIKRIETILVT